MAFVNLLVVQNEEEAAEGAEVGGYFGFPKINPEWAGTKQCFTYLTHFTSSSNASAAAAATTDNSTAAASSIVKYDHCNERVVGEWNGGGSIATSNKLYTEMVFVESPDSGPGGSGGEDDGVLLGTVFDTASQTSEFTVVDAKTMTTFATAPLPFRVSWPLHGTFLDPAS